MGELADRIIEAAYKLGESAAHSCKTLESNPYSSDDPRHSEWTKGWQAKTEPKKDSHAARH